MIGLPTNTMSRMSALSTPLLAQSWPIRPLIASRTAAVISFSPPGCIIT